MARDGFALGVSEKQSWTRVCATATAVAAATIRADVIARVFAGYLYNNPPPKIAYPPG